MSEGQMRSSSVGILVAAPFYFFLNAITQGLVSPTADLDQAQQLLLSQDRAWGYGAQPPLYTWVVNFLFGFSGPNLGVLLGLKAFLLSLLMLGACQVSRQLGLSRTQEQAALLGFALIPQIVWEAQRDLTHSVLATVLGMWTLWAFLRLRRAAEIRDYILLGVLVALGILSKYNYLIFLASLLVAGLATPSFRPRVWCWGMILSLAIAVCALWPHLLWIVSHQDIATASAHKFKMADGFAPEGLASLGMAMLAYSVPLLLAAGLSRSKRAAPRETTEEQRFLRRLLVVVILLLGLIVFLSGTTNVKDRWLQPLLFFLPFFVASAVSVDVRIFGAIAALVLVLAAVILPGRTVWAEWSEKTSRPNLPYAVAFEEIRKDAGEPAVIMSDSELLAGNARLAFPESRIEVVRSPNDFDLAMMRSADKDVLWVSEADSENSWFARLAFQSEREGATMGWSEAPFLYVSKKTMRLNWCMIRNHSLKPPP